MKKKTTKVAGRGNIVISFKSGTSITVRGQGGLNYSGIASLVSTFENQVRSGDEKKYEKVEIPQGSAGEPRSVVAVRLADVSGIAYIPDP